MHTSSAEPVARAIAAIASVTEARAAVLNLIKLTAKTVPRSAPAEMPAALKEQVPGPTEQPAPVTKEVEEAVVAFLKADPSPLVTTRDIRAWAREMVAAVDMEDEKDPQVVDLLRIQVGSSNRKRKSVLTEALIDPGSCLDACNRQFALSCAPPNQWKTLLIPRVTHGAIADTSTRILCYIEIPLRVGDPTLGATLTENRKLFVMDSSIPLLLGKPWIQDREKDGLLVNWTSNFLSFNSQTGPVFAAKTPIFGMPKQLIPQVANAIAEKYTSIRGTNWMLLPEFFTELNREEIRFNRMPFTFDGCCETDSFGNTNNQANLDFCSLPDKDGKLRPLNKENGFFNIPFNDTAEWLATIIARQITASKAGETAHATVILAKQQWAPYTKFLRENFVVEERWEKGTVLFSAAPARAGEGRRRAGSTPVPILVARLRRDPPILTPALTHYLKAAMPRETWLSLTATWGLGTRPEEVSIPVRRANDAMAIDLALEELIAETIAAEMDEATTAALDNGGHETTKESPGEPSLDPL